MVPYGNPLPKQHIEVPQSSERNHKIKPGSAAVYNVFVLLLPFLASEYSCKTHNCLNVTALVKQSK